MKIKKLQIKNYKNLDAELVHESDLIALIGNNGSGKSNLVEAISWIFRSLYKKNDNTTFDYYIEYTTNSSKNIKIDKKKSKITFKLDDEVAIGIDEYLPKKIVAIYSGEELRLWNKVYYPIYDDFIRNINKVGATGIAIKTNLMPQMLYLNKYYWHLSLLSLIISDLSDNKHFVKDVLKINSIEKIKFVFNNSNYKEYRNSSVLSFINIIDKKSEYTLDELKKIISFNGYSDSDIFNYLYIANSPKGTKIVEDIIILYNECLTIEDFSEGEKKLILIKAALEFAGQEDSLFVLDEPDAHIHVNNKEQIALSFAPYQHNRQIIFTTHSPTLTECMKDDNVYMINNGKIEDRNKQEIIKGITNEFWNRHQQTSFLSSTKPIILLVEGKHDKEHISNAFNVLCDEYSDLSFDIFNMDGAANIPQLITGLRTSDVKLNNIVIGIFDNDEEGRDNCNKTKVNYDINSKQNLKGFHAIKYDHDRINKDGFTVENMFEPQHFESAYISSLGEFAGKFENKYIDKISKEIKDRAKTLLSEKSKTFTNKEDFKHFRKLFDLIREINNNYIVLKTQPTTNPQSHTSPTSTISSIKPNITPTAKDNHLAYWTAFKEFVSNQKVSFNLREPKAQHWNHVSIGSSNFNISILANTQKQWIGVQLVCKGEDSLTNFQLLFSLYEDESKRYLANSIEWKENKGKKEHHINYIINNKNPFDKEDWINQHALLSEWTEKFFNYFKNKVKNL